ncbi:OsmC family protein [Fodinibius halophilus]|uniref:Peroxiredoxin n=1 Tax=Fodinibius halophilus TaxID=1736908 RepID=A0A6M1TK81_9BACT|nr:OsmC family protein [Fodinibius halophilus]NGP88960.1 peroxiredoxin [Fodinibius halophilus]
MHRYQATIQWQRNGDAFTDNKYSRKHQWAFDGGVTIAASASPQVVPEPFSDPAVVDPEEAFIASLSSCHMLWFLSIAAQEGYIVDGYSDHAEGKMQKNKKGKLAVTEVILQPVVTFKQNQHPNRTAHNNLHHRAHRRCFIANSVLTDITVDATIGGTS